ncbi:SpoIID/LytB domain-containing protein [Ruminococcus sp.]|uniref:SpoIID/LytB domain-containing protein n=1 Tax=Ruminococcus sp. TaxID=41978 RepID=UPI0025DE6154|nr:SpoIID/LytB domain-containing protein [Ruminococcus sp.]
MKIRYPHAGIAIAIAALLAGTTAVSAYAVPEIVSPVTETAAAESGDTLWKAEISDYDSSLSLVQYEEVNPSEEEIGAMEEATTPKAMESLASSDLSGNTNIGAAASLGAAKAGQFAFTTYGYGHCVGMSQNGANYYASYGGYDYQSILFHYYPGTTLVQENAGGTITANGVTGSILDIISQIVYNEMSSTMHPEAMKAQAVAAYTYIMYNGGSVNNVILKPNPPQNVIDAVSSVLGQALYYDESYALTVYGASSGGATANSGDVWGTQYDYLVSVPCDYDAVYDPNYGVVTYMSIDEVRSRIQSAYGIMLSSNPSNWIQLEVGDSGYVRSVTIDGQKTVNGDSFRGVLGLRSPRFAYICG